MAACCTPSYSATSSPAAKSISNITLVCTRGLKCFSSFHATCGNDNQGERDENDWERRDEWDRERVKAQAGRRVCRNSIRYIQTAARETNREMFYLFQILLFFSGSTYYYCSYHKIT